MPALGVDRLDLEGPGGGRLAASVADRGDRAFRIEAAQVDPSAWQAWLATALPAGIVVQAGVQGRVEAGRLDFDAAATAELPAGRQRATLRMSARGDRGGIHLAALSVAVDGREIARAAGTLPVGWQLAGGPRLWVDRDAPVNLEARIEPAQAYWGALLGRWGLVIADPSLQARIGGTLRQPAGAIDLRAARLGRGGAPADWPTLDDVALRVRAERDAVTLESFAARVEGQAVRAEGRLPMGSERWEQLGRAPATFDWRRLEARVEIPDGDLAAVARRVPALPLVQGRLRAVVRIAAGGAVTGEIHLADGVTRPVDPLGVAQQVSADLALEGRTLAIRRFTAALGGETVSAGGTVAWSEAGRPRLALHLSGRNLPLVRRAGLLLRSDLDLRAETDAAGATRLTGTVSLRDCLVLADLGDLLPTGQQGVTRQPPYFAVTAAPFARWQLGIDVRGPRSVRVQTPVFAGTASPRFRIAGTLGEPRAVGELTVDQGQVFFPFATFDVQTGAIRLAEADPFHPRLSVIAVSNRQDYQLRLEASGSPEAPGIAFSSNPPLEASQVLLLVTTGQPPATTATAAASTQQRLTRLGAYVGKGLFGGLGGGGQGRLEVIAGDQTSRQGRDTYEVDYRLGRRWSLVGEYDEFDDYNAGFKWRFYTAGGKDHDGHP